MRGAMKHCIEMLFGSLCPQIFDFRYSSVLPYFGKCDVTFGVDY